ncbi:hypothetical protein VIGAN_01282100 [Vigna angularis var. angularis]|uniref:Uncharacterized protein n=1 Tax=Vigna angularis var. angularis TaxID=157739 RepID=A0A0S3R3G3_PHAAN|nr:hypothetical protein VIGAN_01282100 [Vigna angularis var. angularis]
MKSSPPHIAYNSTEITYIFNSNLYYVWSMLNPLPIISYFPLGHNNNIKQIAISGNQIIQFIIDTYQHTSILYSYICTHKPSGTSNPKKISNRTNYYKESDRYFACKNNT